jgi:hypothetical protein
MTLTAGDPTADRVITLPNATDTLVGKNTQDTLTNKSISGSQNTLTSIPNASLVNSSFTLNGTVVSLGGTTEISTGGGKYGTFLMMGA